MRFSRYGIARKKSGEKKVSLKLSCGVSIRVGIETPWTRASCAASALSGGYQKQHLDYTAIAVGAHRDSDVIPLS